MISLISTQCARGLGVFAAVFCLVLGLFAVTKAVAGQTNDRYVGPVRVVTTLQGVPGDADDVGGYRDQFSEDERYDRDYGGDGNGPNPNATTIDRRINTYTVKLYITLLSMNAFILRWMSIE